ncbi:MAG: Uma2 family endonuclease [Anaerolineae bacterium]|nr:Uma2 family endonuclease [Anaerolineae bacterium]
MTLREKLYSFDEFWEIINLPENADRRFELDEGVIVDVGPSSAINSVITGRLIYFLNAFVIPRNLGMVTTPDAGFKVGTRSYRQPDVAFISKRTSTSLAGTYFTVAPDLAVEVVSEDEDIFRKAAEYLHAGTQIVWAVYAADRRVYVMTLNPDRVIESRLFTESDILDGGAVLPGFTLPVREIFPA